MLLIAADAVSAPVAKKQVGVVKFGGYRSAVLYRDRMELTGGRPFVNAEDGSFRIEADKLVLVFATPQKDETSVRTAAAEGGVVVMAKPEPGQQVDATAAKAEYLGDQDKVVMTGKVRVVVTYPARFAEPAVLVGETATFNLRPKADEWRIRVEGAPGQSELTVKPKPQE